MQLSASEKRLLKLSRTLAGFGGEVDGVVLEAYEAGLADIGDEKFYAACKRAVFECEFRPSVATLRRFAAEVDAMSPDAAWNFVRLRVNKYSGGDFGAILNATVRECGGLVPLCNMQDNCQFMRKQFIASYEHALSRKLGEDESMPLRGRDDCEIPKFLPGVRNAPKQIESKSESASDAETPTGYVTRGAPQKTNVPPKESLSGDVWGGVETGNGGDILSAVGRIAAQKAIK